MEIYSKYEVPSDFYGVENTAQIANNPGTWTKSTKTTTFTSRVTAHKTYEALKTSIRVTTSSASSSVTPVHYSASRRFIQMINRTNPVLYIVPEGQLLETSFRGICPSGNCVDDCKNMSRVFQAVPDGLNIDPLRYGRPETQVSNVTLFGTCSNLEFATKFAVAERNTDFTPYFSTNDSRDLFNIAANMASCFAAATCEQTRKPTVCAEACSPSKLLSSPTAFDYEQESGFLNCVLRLCDHTCSLPYVNQDVLGIGVLISYYIQAVVLVICASAIVVSAGLQLWRASSAEKTIRDSLRSPLETFLRVQALFGTTEYDHASRPL
ncbi:uncharacterized protein BDZ83DRAFT_773192 [Colletotrichum acutatum]|uniref:Uncharacterized protein n=1 Tax=Glomerella acutata TaxID=27357 RepID=A0AAD8U6X2_GLOAC|nr:uncharacterized protein BDZ83DRAFT_773192 [Colletotrichum acutatum]KAK1702947.1 hypothetical protein BDZ83DRAFT_773192 [Colletotrichum acutatum]